MPGVAPLNKLLKTLLVSLAPMTVVACAAAPADRVEVSRQVRYACSQWLPFLESRDSRTRLLQWADAEVFRQSFSSSDFRVGHFSGPGLRSATFNAQSGRLHVPEGLLPGPVSGRLPAVEIRVVGDVEKGTTTIFIGGGRYQGVVIARDRWEGAVDGRHIRAGMIDARVDRVGLICHVGG